MTIRDRGKMKWQFAFGMPELIKAQHNLWRDTERTSKPIIDEYESEEFDLRICYAMEYNLAVKLTKWNDGFTDEIIGHVHYVDPITHQPCIEVKPGEFERVSFEAIVGVEVFE